MHAASLEKAAYHVEQSLREAGADETYGENGEIRQIDRPTVHMFKRGRSVGRLNDDSFDSINFLYSEPTAAVCCTDRYDASHLPNYILFLWF